MAHVGRSFEWNSLKYIDLISTDKTTHQSIKSESDLYIKYFGIFLKNSTFWNSAVASD